MRLWNEREWLDWSARQDCNGRLEQERLEHDRLASMGDINDAQEEVGLLQLSEEAQRRGIQIGLRRMIGDGNTCNHNDAEGRQESRALANLEELADSHPNRNQATTDDVNSAGNEQTPGQNQDSQLQITLQVVSGPPDGPHRVQDS